MTLKTFFLLKLKKVVKQREDEKVNQARLIFAISDELQDEKKIGGALCWQYEMLNSVTMNKALMQDTNANWYWNSTPREWLFRHPIVLRWQKLTHLRCGIFPDARISNVKHCKMSFVLRIRNLPPDVAPEMRHKCLQISKQDFKTGITVKGHLFWRVQFVSLVFLLCENYTTNPRNSIWSSL